MQGIKSFYDNMDLKYMEIGVAMQEINRKNPGMVKFNIPVLTPNMDNSKIISNQLIHQSRKNLKNYNKNLDIQNITICNYMNIPLPAELCYTQDSEDTTIPFGSRWVIAFIGGDITKPRPLARYLDK